MDTNHHFSDYFTDLDLFSRLPPNTDVHVARDGHFVPNGGAYSAISGVQTAANYWKGYTSDRLATEIDKFAHQVIDSLKNIFDKADQSNDTALQRQTFCQLKVAHVAIENAIQGSHGGGMQGLLGHHTEEPCHTKLENAITFMKNSMAEFQKRSKEWKGIEPEWTAEHKEGALPFCPEEFFNDHDWEKAMSAAATFKPESIGMFKYYGKYTAALGLTQTNVSLGSWNWSDKIIQFGDNGASLHLGALPLRREAFGQEWRNDLQAIKDAGIEAVLSVVEVFENNSDGLVASPIKPTEWKEAGIKQLQLPTPDFESIPFELIQRGVAFLDWNIKKGRSVYVHCKAGRGRSALIEMCYLIKHHGYTAKDAFALIRAQRKQAGFNEGDAKMITLLEYEKLIKAKQTEKNNESIAK